MSDDRQDETKRAERVHAREAVLEQERAESASPNHAAQCGWAKRDAHLWGERVEHRYIRKGAPTAANLERLGLEIGKLLGEKNAAYGDSFNQTKQFAQLLYPEGVAPDQVADLLSIIRIFDKLKRIATNRDAFGESPWRDIAGYAILAFERIEREGKSNE